MSGGVDSSVAALLLKQQGHDVVGAYMKNWINEDNVVGDCPWQQDIEDARAVAEQLGIEFRVVNLMREYRARIVDYLLDGYARGLTPNPGHHVQPRDQIRRVPRVGEGPRLRRGRHRPLCATGGTGVRNRRPERESRVPGRRSGLRSPVSALEGADKNKDQSYFLALLSQEQLRDARFPIGHLPKPELRALAREAGLPTADKKDSQGICFIGEVKMADFLRAYVPDAPGPDRPRDGRTRARHASRAAFLYARPAQGHRRSVEHRPRSLCRRRETRRRSRTARGLRSSRCAGFFPTRRCACTR